MNINKLIDKIETILQKDFIKKHGGKINVGKGWAENIHVVVVSDIFKDKSFSERDAMVWPLLRDKLEEHEIVQISLCLLLASDEVPVTSR